MTVEHLQPLLDHPRDLQAFLNAAEKVSRAHIPPAVQEAIRLGRLTTSEGKRWGSRDCRGRHCQEACGTDNVPTAHGFGTGRHSTIPVCDVNQEWV